MCVRVSNENRSELVSEKQMTYGNAWVFYSKWPNNNEAWIGSCVVTKFITKRERIELLADAI